MMSCLQEATQRKFPHSSEIISVNSREIIFCITVPLSVRFFIKYLAMYGIRLKLLWPHHYLSLCAEDIQADYMFKERIFLCQNWAIVSFLDLGEKKKKLDRDGWCYLFMWKSWLCLFKIYILNSYSIIFLSDTNINVPNFTWNVWIFNTKLF